MYIPFCNNHDVWRWWYVQYGCIFYILFWAGIYMTLSCCIHTLLRRMYNSLKYQKIIILQQKIIQAEALPIHLLQAIRLQMTTVTRRRWRTIFWWHTFPIWKWMVKTWCFLPTSFRVISIPFTRDAAKGPRTPTIRMRKNLPSLSSGKRRCLRWEKERLAAITLANIQLSPPSFCNDA